MVARFSAPETGGAAHPRFVEERALAFEARLEVMAEKAEGTGEAYQERHVRDALERLVGEELLASLANKLITESSPSRRPTETELSRKSRKTWERQSSISWEAANAWTPRPRPSS